MFTIQNLCTFHLQPTYTLAFRLIGCKPPSSCLCYLLALMASCLSLCRSLMSARIYSVRGPYTEKWLREQGLPTAAFIGDPALLLPLVYPDLAPRLTPSSPACVVSHYSDYRVLQQKIQNNHTPNLHLISTFKPGQRPRCETHQKCCICYLHCFYLLSVM